MTKKEFLDLLIKYEQGNCSKAEVDLLFTLYETFQNDNVMGTWGISEKERTKLKLLERINKSIKNQEVNRSKKGKTIKLARIAAVFVGLMVVGGYLYVHDLSGSNAIVESEDAITLQLEDGSVKVIKEDGSTKILDQGGNVVGEQHEDQLVYKETEAPRELVYNTLNVPYGKTFELQLSDGTTVHLNAGSSLKYPTQFVDGMDREVFVEGEAFLDVKKDSLHPFIVNADNLKVRVLGTQFNVHSYPEDEVAEIVLVEGSVDLYTDTEEFDVERHELLKPGYKASFNRKNKEIVTDSVITDMYVSWIKGELVFRNMTFDHILKKLERHFDVKIINKNEGLSDEKFNASFGNVAVIGEVLQELRTTYDITFSVEGDTIIIHQ